MKRPIAELLVMTVNAGAEVERGRLEHEAWQILRRKQGYVTHRIYQHLDNPLLQDWTTPFQVPPFQEIKPEHFLPALKDALADLPQEKSPDTR